MLVFTAFGLIPFGCESIRGHVTDGNIFSNGRAKGAYQCSLAPRKRIRRFVKCAMR